MFARKSLCAGLAWLLQGSPGAGAPHCPQGQRSWEWSWEQCWEHALGLRKPHLISVLCIQSATQQNDGASTEMGPRSGGAGVQHPHTEHIWLADPKLSLRSPFFHQQVPIITRQHMKAISSSGPHILSCTLCFCLPRHHQTSLSPHPQKCFCMK